MRTNALAATAFLLLVFRGAAFAQNSAGLFGEYFAGENFERRVGQRIDAAIDFDWPNTEPMPGQGAESYSIRWTGKIRSSRSGEHLFRAIVDDGIRVFIDGQKVFDAWGWNDSPTFVWKTRLEAGRYHDLKIEYFNSPREGELKLRWQLPGDEPFFGGAFGYNDQPIPASSFFHEEAVPPKPIAQKKSEKNAETPVPKPADPKPEQKARPKPAAATLRDSAEKYLPKNIGFVRAKAEMLSGSTDELERLAAFLNRNPSLRIRIEGHTDTVGDRAQNLLLSKQRAQACADFLMEKGIARERIEHEGYGSERPLTADPSPAEQARNRRVEFFLK